jgi:uncharacterized protein (DUF885 family)
MQTRLAILILIFLAIPAAARSQTKPATPPADTLEKLADDFWAWRAQYQPFSPDDIPRIERPGGTRDWSRAAIAKQRAALREFQVRWEKLAPAAWPVAKQVDYRLIGSALARIQWELELNPRWLRDPNFYIEQTLTPLVEALVVPPPFDEARSREILTRIENIPDILKAGETNLDKIPAPFASVAIQALDGIRPLLLTMTETLRPSTMLNEQELKGAAMRAAAALEEFRGCLQERLPSLANETALGREAYAFFLRNVALLPYTPEQLLAISRQEWERAVAFEKLEAQRNQGVPLLRLAPDLDAWARDAANKEEFVRQFLEKKGILTVPLWVRHYTLRPMPEYLRAISAFGETDDFSGPSRLKEDCIRYINPPSPQLSYFWRATAQDPRPITVHEGVPGHYFQLVLSWAHRDPIRRHYYDSSANEGIGFYAEEMMLQSGLFDDSPHSREIIYNFMRLRALRVEVDVKLALGQLTLEQAAEYLEKKVPMDRATARAEAIAFATAPGQAISYQIGKLQILKFLADTRMQLGDAFNLRSFHDFLWRNGNVPIALQRWEFLGLTDQLNQ